MARRGAFIAVTVVLAACARAPVAPPVAQAPPPPAVPAVPAPAVSAPLDPQALLAGMTLEEKVGQLMMVGFKGQAVDDEVAALVRGRRVGGVCLFNRNLADAPQIAKLNDDLRALMADAVPPFLAVDQEGGSVVRVDDGNVVLPGNMVLGAARDEGLAYEAGRAQGEDLWRLGFNMNLAPVLDVNSNPMNPVIGVRAFGDDVKLVASLGAAFVRGQQDAAIVTVAKHFPGHGAVDADSHRRLPVVKAPLSQVWSQLEPFEAAMKAGLDGMMTAHIATPALTGDDTPATLSPRVLGTVLRQQLGFHGLVVTDELEMDAIDARWGVGRAAVLAINAGADMVLVPWRSEKKLEVWEALVLAARSGELPQARLDDAVLRILEVKVRRGIFTPLPPREERLAALGSRRDVAERIARAGVTLLRASPAVFPLRPGQRVGLVTAEPALSQALSRRLPAVEVLEVPAIPAPEAREGLKRSARALAQQVDVVVVGVVNSRQLELAVNAALAGKPVVVVVMGAPYLASQAHSAKAIVTVYSSRPEAAEAAAAALTGAQGTPGRLPVALGKWPYGFGLDPGGQRLAGTGDSTGPGSSSRPPTAAP
ncbi:MAG: beta-N-acetylhexosaminidase [Myxococcota bacterium]